MGQEAVITNPRANHGGDECFPGVGVLVREDDDHASVWFKGTAGVLERSSHPIFILLSSYVPITGSPGMLYQFPWFWR